MNSWSPWCPPWAYPQQRPFQAVITANSWGMLSVFVISKYETFGVCIDAMITKQDIAHSSNYVLIVDRNSCWWKFTCHYDSMLLLCNGVLSLWCACEQDNGWRVWNETPLIVCSLTSYRVLPSRVRVVSSAARVFAWLWDCSADIGAFRFGYSRSCSYLHIQIFQKLDADDSCDLSFEELKQGMVWRPLAYVTCKLHVLCGCNTRRYTARTCIRLIRRKTQISTSLTTSCTSSSMTQISCYFYCYRKNGIWETSMWMTLRSWQRATGVTCDRVL